MKKIFLLLTTVIGTLAFTSCTNNDDRVDNDTISEVFEVDNVNFTATGNFRVTVPLNPSIYSSDVILLYRLSGSTSNGKDIWEPVPTSYTFNAGTANEENLKYFFDFSQDDITIYLEADFDPLTRQDFSLNQVFRVAIVPGYFSQTVNTNDFDAVMSAISAQNGSDVQIEKR
ncbi:hypothetical protein HYN59_16660 [Flavobacterium album]|uniref:Dihydrolipoamide dehydrogenase n=1 Tax=Flavobacterium album TaxID=2175091 RepID=A0A2S1R1U0_9FLAO|nr:hypothetical protein [Flavobacterium album]AWH86638.1 hypothetical protein HYN59_16660 [Flavobacterium album]